MLIGERTIRNLQSVGGIILVLAADIFERSANLCAAPFVIRAASLKLIPWMLCSRCWRIDRGRCPQARG